VARNSIWTKAEPESVFAVLDDACAYPRWVVGTRRVRRVDPSWPQVGAQFHHAVGTAAGELHDSSKMLERDPPRKMVLEVRFRPTGVARVEINVIPESGGSTITLEETPLCGPISRVPRFVVDALLAVRNALSLQRLRHEIEKSTTPSRSAG
jgi:uncharacterized protein YndB with AHSA1/START domain